MPQIRVENLTFCYPGKYDNIFENVSFLIDTDWKLGLIGRNGRGKTTFFNLLAGQYAYEGRIHASVPFETFPYAIQNKEDLALRSIEAILPDTPLWQVEKELSLLELNPEVLYRPFSVLSKGEQTKIQLAALFLKGQRFLLIDEPTNHLDTWGRKLVSEYLNRKSGFIVISHDRDFLDGCIDHVLALNRCNIEVSQGNFTTWWDNKENRDRFELQENERLRKDIKRLTASAGQKKQWSDAVEASKIGNGPCDRGYIGKKSAKMMQRSKSIQTRIQSSIEEKEKLLKDVEVVDDLKISALHHRKRKLIAAKDLSLRYQDRQVFAPVEFVLEEGQRVAFAGRNGCGKSSLIRKILGDDIAHTGTIEIASGLVISYVPQDTSFLKGSLSAFVDECGIDGTRFRTVLRKLDFSREHFDKGMEEYSDGQRKKVLLAKSLCERAHLYIWDEPLNYIDVFSRMQIEQTIRACKPTMILVEHDAAFIGKVATEVVPLQ